MLAPPPDFSQRATSFIASRRQGIHQMPLVHSPRSSSEPPFACALARGPQTATDQPLEDEVPTGSTAAEHRPGTGPKRSNNKHTMLKRSPTPKAEPERRTAPIPFQHGRTRATNAAERRCGQGTSPYPLRRSIALPAFDQTCLFTMYKEHPPERPSATAIAATDRYFRGNHVTSLSPPGSSNMPNEWRAHAIGVVGLG